MRLSLCSRCGECETTCSRGLPISSMFRDAYIWSYGNETFMADDRENYFALHPRTPWRAPRATTRPACVRRASRCRAPSRRSTPVRSSARERPASGPVDRLDTPRDTMAAPRPARQPRGARGRGGPSVARFLVQNAGEEMWTAFSHDGAGRRSPSRSADGGAHRKTPLRQNICPGQRSPVVVEFRAPSAPGALRLSFRPDAADRPPRWIRTTLFHRGRLTVEPRRDGRIARRSRAGARVSPGISPAS